jgi:hypothetical protein
LPAHPFGLFQHPEQVAPQDLLHVPLRIASLQQGVSQPRQERAVLHAEGHRSAVEIGAQPDVVHPGQLGRVVDVLDDLSQPTQGSVPAAIASRSRRSPSTIWHASSSPQIRCSSASSSSTLLPRACLALRAS